ncbi:MAG: TIGR00375 family protein [Candidatus Aenigmarchaeota archaeon ex4484_56]|nr:MAG: TIGR00375 family protein [Candidatus Aenigmarchaeota archaeon ex4484_56]
MDFIEINADLHIHSKYAGGTSDKMDIPILSEQAKLKGVNLLGTGDCLHPKWIKHLKENLKGEGIYEYNETKFILQTEVQDKDRIHHVIFLPSFSKAEELREKLKKYSKNIDSDGRPWLDLNGKEICEFVFEANGIIGPAHAFTPYFGLYAHYNSLEECYSTNKISFLELGLSADSYLADKISELHKLTLLSNSDCHSPYPLRLAREFNRLKIKELKFEELEKAFLQRDKRMVTLNCGFYPEHGKYHLSRCRKCLTFYRLEDAIKLNWKCAKCGGMIKKGVKDRILELADCEGNPDRVRYLHIYPLIEIIAISHKIKTFYSKEVSKIWYKFINKFGDEIKILVDVPIEDLEKVDKEVARYINAFREDKIRQIPGGGGVYGKLLPLDEDYKIKFYKQKSLIDFRI